MSSTAWQRVSSWGCVLAGLVLAAASPALAGMGTSTAIEGYRYAFNLADRAAEPIEVSTVRLPLSVGVGGLWQNRELDFDAFGEWDAEMLHLGAWLGVDVLPWLTLRGQLGSSGFDVDLAGVGDLGNDLEWGVGVEARVLNRQVEPMLANISWIRFDASAHCLGGAVEDGDNKASRLEFYSDLTVSIVTTPKELDTVKSIALFVGPAVSLIRGNLEVAGGADSDFREGQVVGVVGGLVLIPHDTISIKAEVQYFDDFSFGASLGYHF